MFKSKNPLKNIRLTANGNAEATDVWRASGCME